ncbi:MAG: M24 family metallopeptidase [Acidobacteria bacterium]|nr:M24 family metallopeptidase [Acidobacteriota bacterium]
MTTADDELDVKRERLARVAEEAGVQGVLLATHHNVAWITGGRSNRIDGSRDAGSARLLITPQGRRMVFANTIEMPRLIDEVLAGLDYEPVEFPWTEDQADPGCAVTLALKALGPGAVVASDWPLPGATVIEGRIARARALLTSAEVGRYRALGRDAGIAIGSLCRTLVPGLEEREIARRAADALAAVGARGIVVLVGSDERLLRYRHPVATSTRWRNIVMVVVCAERDGLVAALSRIVCAGPVPDDLALRTRVAATVFGRLLDASRPGATAARLYAVAAEAYEAAGYPGEELRHHQGGAIGYRSREWVAHPRSSEVVEARQAFAWNPSLPGAKVEDTSLVLGDDLDVITTTPDWPVIPVEARGHTVMVSDVWSVV